nr:hypothetical protein BgiMline_030165 [Biomphalaria glabrata]
MFDRLRSRTLGYRHSELGYLISVVLEFLSSMLQPQSLTLVSCWPFSPSSALRNTSTRATQYGVVASAKLSYHSVTSIIFISIFFLSVFFFLSFSRHRVPSCFLAHPPFLTAFDPVSDLFPHTLPAKRLLLSSNSVTSRSSPMETSAVQCPLTPPVCIAFIYSS